MEKLSKVIHLYLQTSIGSKSWTIQLKEVWSNFWNIYRDSLRAQKFQTLYRVSQKKGIDKKLFVGAAHDFNPQFLNLFGFNISVSFVWCII